ncbi:hypothetical protein FOTG_08944 [Fusarium oxysporum f. sp. vasinfectum 25433]|uniref:Uncharacterized protein n=1 Tax=Fusarium oxysporum f. sp. vasinfectum 25433 TaxID=1089449 RepID=X0LDK7_FUSOX|nr:hypothetical protein FOTG_08944 [Fusarium oxysporum f. sp. vasinfectum 25433]
MPPIRTEKSNSAADAPAPGTDAPKKRLLKPVVKGAKDAISKAVDIVFGARFVFTEYVKLISFSPSHAET